MLIFIILAQTTTLCLLVWLTTTLNWFCYILFLIFLGGLIVLFVYITRLASNEVFSLNVKNRLIYTATLLTVATLISEGINSQLKNQSITPTLKRFAGIYSEAIVLPSSTTIIYLLLTLIVVVKVTSKYEGPIRSLIFAGPR